MSGQPTPTAAAMRAAEAVHNYLADRINRSDPAPWDEIAAVIDKATGLPELLNLAGAVLELTEKGEPLPRWAITCLREEAKKALACLEAPQSQLVADPPTQPDPLPRLAQQIWRALPYDHAPGVVIASASDMETALRRAVPLAQVRIIDAETAPVAQASATEEDAGE